MLQDYPYLDRMPSFARDGVPLLTGFRRDTIAPSVVLAVRDPLVVGEGAADDAITACLDDAVVVARTGLFTTVSGTYRGVPISVVSGGSGSPEAELALMDLFNYTDARTVIRIGGCGGWGEKVGVGDVVISSGAVRDEGMTKSHVRTEYPAVADWRVVRAMAAEAAEIGCPHHVGITRTGDSEYCGWGRPGPDGYLQDDHKGIIDYWRRAGILNTDRETAAVLTLCTLYGRRGGSVCSVGDNVVTGEAHRSGAGQNAAILVGLGALARLAQEEQAR
ncbi:nucleoside phosphorylase [Mesorhizobium sp. BAC0120]|uniref:nucleoside phosphorylase n=1 Tax=Mesorhizobium sp. BAC0120 TaxID=3090670 RepID=UPI00298D2626|nr:nucleoside phosphorylase [Mesorhizobium sp. BAC0120]MDW6021630.1 nucleoside phosphorylase [Mesorhizobium sp. BAC0120]